ncbi:MAG: YkgJ family cysteine cluster protein [Myxococcaceae bacterium]
MTTRTCSSCTACCTTLRIDSVPGLSTRFDTGEDLAKPAGVPCKYLNSAGCTIYEVRPGVCRRFQCDWKLGLKEFPEQNAPLRIGYFGKNRHLFVISD